jgi:alpha-mannosidase
MRNQAPYPASVFQEAWNSALLYSEHTWGAHCSVWGPEKKETLEQWEIKRGYALRADQQSRELLEQATGGKAGPPVFEVHNTVAWPRTDLAVLSGPERGRDDAVFCGQEAQPSQRLTSGELVFLARVPGLTSQSYRVQPGEPKAPDTPATAQGETLDNGLLRVRLDPKTGAIAELTAKGLEGNLVDTASGHAVNDFLYFNGSNPANAQRNGDVKVSVKERGPLVASLLIESDAPGCHKLTREVRLIAGLDRVELINTVDKKRIGPAKAPEHYYDKPEAKESLNFAFPFAVKEGTVRLEGPLSVFDPCKDLLPSACKNWFTVNRWADVSNAERGVTWVTLDAPLVQVGGLTANLLSSQGDPSVWRKSVEPTQKLYSWAMNNHWHTNYRAYQEGVVVFRYALRPHRAFDAAEAARFGAGLAQPLRVGPEFADGPLAGPRLRVEPADVLVEHFKPSDDGKAWIVRLYGASGEIRKAKLIWGRGGPKSVARSDLSEKPGAAVNGEIEVPGWGLVTLRAER